MTESRPVVPDAVEPTRKPRPLDKLPEAGMPDEAWFACMTGDCEHATQAECDRWLRTEMIELAKVNLELETELQATSEALGEGDFDSISKHAAALRADLAAARSLVRDATRDTARIVEIWRGLPSTVRNFVTLAELADFIESRAALSAAPIPAEEPHD